MEMIRSFLIGFVIIFFLTSLLTFVALISAYAELNIIREILRPISGILHEPLRPMWKRFGLLDNVENPGSLIDIFIPIIFWSTIGGVIAMIIRWTIIHLKK